MPSGTSGSPEGSIESLIFWVRGQQVILDADLAAMYGAPTRRLNEQVKRNRDRFPVDFLFRLSPEEVVALQAGKRSQIATASRRNLRYPPFAFTEHGAIMAANVLNSRRAVQMSVFVVRAFVRMRLTLANSRDFAAKLAVLEQELKARLDVHEAAIVSILQRVMDLIDPPATLVPKPREIGFHVPPAAPERPARGRKRSHGAIRTA